MIEEAHNWDIWSQNLQSNLQEAAADDIQHLHLN